MVLGAGGRALAFEASDLLAIGAGPFVLHPQFQVAEQFDDNIYYQRAKTEDFLTILTPGFDLRTRKPEADYNFDLSYSYSWIFYAKNSTDNAMDQTASLSGSYQGTRVRFEGRAGVQYLNSIYGGLESFLGGYYGVVPQNLDRVLPVVEGKLTYDLTGKVSAYARGTFQATDFLQEVLLPNFSTLYDNNVWKAYGGAEFKPTEKLGVFAEAYYGQSALDPTITYFPKPEHFVSLGGSLGVRGSFTSKLSGDAQVGYENLSNSSMSASVPTAAVHLNAQLTDKLSAVLGYTRQVNVPTVISYSGGSITPYVDDSLNGSVQAILGSSHPVQISVTAGYSVGSTSNSNSGQSYASEYYTAGLNVNYQFARWVSAGIGYQYQTSLSPGYSYDVNMVTLNVFVGYR
jgi:hypothetical protein